MIANIGLSVLYSVIRVRNCEKSCVISCTSGVVFSVSRKRVGAINNENVNKVNKSDIKIMFLWKRVNDFQPR